MIKNLIEQYRARRAERQKARCARGRHHYKYSLDRIVCSDPGCGKRYSS